MNKRGKNKCFPRCNFFIKNRRGSHVGIMVSFVIFVTFLIFVFAVLEPSISSQKGKKAILNFLEAGIIGETSYDMTSGTIRLASSLGAGCIELNSGRTELGIGKRIIAKDNSEKALNSYISASNENNLKIQGTTPPTTFLKIVYSGAFGELGMSSSSCTVLNEGSGYYVGLTKTEKYLFETKIIELIGRYSDYDVLRNELKIPEGTEFGYGIKLSNGTAIETYTEYPETDVYIKETPIQYVDSNGNILIGYLKTKIW